MLGNPATVDLRLGSFLRHPIISQPYLMSSARSSVQLNATVDGFDAILRDFIGGKLK